MFRNCGPQKNKISEELEEPTDDSEGGITPAHRSVCSHFALTSHTLTVLSSAPEITLSEPRNEADITDLKMDMVWH